MKRVLVVIDVQNEYIDGNLPISYPPLSRSLPNIERTMDAAQAAGIPVVVVQQVAPEGSPIFGRGSRGAELHASIAGRDRDLLVDKALPSCFTGTGLDAVATDRPLAGSSVYASTAVARA